MVYAIGSYKIIRTLVGMRSSFLYFPLISNIVDMHDVGNHAIEARHDNRSSVIVNKKLEEILILDSSVSHHMLDIKERLVDATFMKKDMRA